MNVMPDSVRPLDVNECESENSVVTADPDSKCLMKGVTISRLTLPIDANVYGNVHGGTILKMIEDAGTIIATRYCNRATICSEPCVAAMVRIEHVDFLQSMYIGEVAELTAEIIFTSPHSLLVEIKVHGENIVTGFVIVCLMLCCDEGAKRMTNCARLWYVPVGKSAKVLTVPVMPYESPQQEKFGRELYEKQKAVRSKINEVNHSFGKDTPNTVCLSVLIGANDVTMTKHCRAGVLLKLMDECAGIVAAKHCQKNVVTACLNATNFYQMIPVGSLVTVRGLLTFTSARSMEIEVIVDTESIFENEADPSVTTIAKKRAVDAFFTFVCIDSNGKAIPVPLLQINTEEEIARFEAGKERYENRRRRNQ